METAALKAQRLLEQLYRMKEGQQDEVPAGFQSAKDLAKAWGLKRSQADRTIKEMLAAKILKPIRLRRFIKGKIHVVNYYG